MQTILPCVQWNCLYILMFLNTTKGWRVPRIVWTPVQVQTIPGARHCLVIIFSENKGFYVGQVFYSWSWLKVLIGLRPYVWTALEGWVLLRPSMFIHEELVVILIYFQVLAHLSRHQMSSFKLIQFLVNSMTWLSNSSNNDIFILFVVVSFGA